MAAQSPSYIGSKISLISNLDIRYEGTLYAVDPVESTIVLAKVHSFGTEDRHAPVFVPPHAEVYEYIIFKASDIKDLIVCEQAELAASNDLPFDPAIVSISKVPPPEPKMSSNMNQHFNYRSPNIQSMPSSQPFRAKFSNSSNPPSEEPRIYDRKDYDFEKANQQFRDLQLERSIEGLDLKRKDSKDDEHHLPVENLVKAIEGEHKEYNLDVDDVEEEGRVQEGQDFYYNKNCSFFDNISCDSLEKESGKNVRPDWKRERRTNQETFGTAAVRSIHSRGGGRRGGGYSSGGGFSTGGGNFGGQPPPSYRSNYRQSTFEPTNPTQQMFPAKTRGFQNSQYNRGFQTGNVQHPPNVGYRRGNTTRGGNSY